jgi:hypothetical protein
MHSPEQPPDGGRDPGSGPVTLRTADHHYKVPGELLTPLAMQWYYMVRRRSRWSDSPEARLSLTQTAVENLRPLGVTETILEKIAAAGLVEISVPYQRESFGWASRILPWEFLLRAATQRSDLTVVRHLDVAGGCSKLPVPPSKLLFVQSTPGPPLTAFSFDTERCLVEGSLRLKNKEELDTPTANILSAKIAAFKPDVIHLAGFDIHQGDDILERYNRSVRPDRQIASEGKQEWDGLYLAGVAAREAHRVDSGKLGKILNPQGAGCALVTCNFYHSAARVAAMAVASGSAAAIGFQDVVEDTLAERFYASFFQQWRNCDWDLLGAFEQSWKRVGGDGADSGAVLWSAVPLLGARRTAAVRRKKVEAPQPLKIGADKRTAVAIHVKPNPDVNYSLLHNGEGLFDTFRFEKYEPRFAYGIHVSVALQMGAESFPYEATFDLDADEPVLDIASRVNLPLTSQFARSLREEVLTSLRVCVSYDGQELYQETHRVKLLAVNQWAFDRTEGGRWLASFILPGDPAVPRIVDAAQKYLMALKDDPAAGFDGYQSTEEDGVDMQVRAIWAALSFDLPLSYINPPPVFTEGSQRLRTPSDVINGKRGTCIDLALLFAACLEFVEIYPVVFVLTDHAFPGYWRSERSYQDFLEMRKIPDAATGEIIDASATAQRRLRFEEVRQCVRDGELVPLETVWLTNHSGFGEAVEKGIDNLRTSSNFESLVNVFKLRGENVTPLPIAGEMK